MFCRTGAALFRKRMGPWTRDIRLALSCLLLLHFLGNSVGTADDCALAIRVPRNTVWKVFTEQPLKINCSLTSCGRRANVSWCKLIHSHCESVRETDRIKITQIISERRTSVWQSFLHFTHAILNDTGNYRCEVRGNVTTTVSHSINVNVTVSQNSENVTSVVNMRDAPVEENKIFIIHYIFIYSGVVILIFIVLGLSFCILRQCQGSHRRENIKSQYQCNATEEPNQTAPRPDPPVRTKSVRTHPTSLLAGNSEFHGITPERRMSRKKSTKASVRTPPTESQTAYENYSAGCSTNIYDNDNCEQGAELTSIVYATLNHQPPKQNPGTIRTSLLAEEFSEYAAIRVS